MNLPESKNGSLIFWIKISFLKLSAMMIEGDVVDYKKTCRGGTGHSSKTVWYAQALISVHTTLG